MQYELEEHEVEDECYHKLMNVEEVEKKKKMNISHYLHIFVG
jgi:hypothetical protein